MKIQVASDLHLEFFKDDLEKEKLLSSFKDVDVLILAGDIINFYYQKPLKALDDLMQLCDNCKNVIYITGNHEYYNLNSNYVHDLLSSFTVSNFHWLNNSYINIENQRFIGCTLWFEENILAAQNINDFFIIKDFDHFVFQSNKQSLLYLKDNVNTNDIVITHHLPTTRSIHKKFANSNNYGFYTKADEIIINNNPKMWIHGHTHCSTDYIYESTRILCNPFGYKEYEENEDYYSLILNI